MTPDKILEIARRELPVLCVHRFPKDIISFAQAIIEERESIGEPVAWVSCDGYLSHYRLGDEYIPLYRHPQPKARMTDEEMNDELVKAYVYQAVTAFARAIERRINGEKD